MRTEDGRIVETPVEALAGFLDQSTFAMLIATAMLTIGLVASICIGFLAR